MRNSLFFRLPCPPLAKRGSLTHSQALALSKRTRDVTSMLLRRFFPTTPSLLHKEGSTAFPKPFSPQGTRDATAPPVALNRCALRLAGHQSPRQDCFSGDEPAGVNTYKWLCGDEPAGVNTYKMVGAGWDRRGAIADFQVHPLLRLSGFEGLHYAEGMSLPGCS